MGLFTDVIEEKKNIDEGKKLLVTKNKVCEDYFKALNPAFAVKMLEYYRNNEDSFKEVDVNYEFNGEHLIFSKGNINCKASICVSGSKSYPLVTDPYKTEFNLKDKASVLYTSSNGQVSSPISDDIELSLSFLKSAEENVQSSIDAAITDEFLKKICTKVVRNLYELKD